MTGAIPTGGAALLQLHGIVLQVKGPPNPRHTRRQGGLVPTHGHLEHTEQDHEKGGEERCR